MEKNYDILAIDDERIILDSIKMIAGSEHFTVDFANNSSEIFKKIENNTYKLILCDIMMPDITGFDVLKFVLEKNLITPVIVTTGYSTTEYAIKSYTLNALEFLPKPFNFDELITSINRGVRCYENNKNGKCSFEIPKTHKKLGKYCWINTETTDGAYQIGITPMFLKIIGEIQSISLCKQGEFVIQAGACGNITAKDELVHNIPASLSGRILEVNDSFINNFDELLKSPYQNWLYRLIPSDFDYDIKYLN